MADTKITALAAITTVDPAADVLPIVDVSDTSMAASGTTKKITSNQILGAGGTATLASATISGDLTVATSGLKIDSATGRSAFNASTYASSIGVMQSSASYYAGLTLRNSAGTYSGSIGLDASGSGGGSQDVSLVAVGTNLSLYSGNNLQYKIAHPGVFTWYDGAGGTRMTLNSTGLGVGVTPSAGRGAIQLSAGVGFPATQVASSDANTLDDYEEGTWTPDLKFGGNNTGMTYTIQAARYVKIGRQVTVNCIIVLSAKGSSTGSAFITGLPFTSANATAAHYAGSIRVDGVAFSTVPQCYIGSNSSSVVLESVATTASPVVMSDTSFTNSSVLILTIEYSV